MWQFQQVKSLTNSLYISVFSSMNAGFPILSNIRGGMPSAPLLWSRGVGIPGFEFMSDV